MQLLKPALCFIQSELQHIETFQRPIMILS